jgi:thioredoxin-like negative regulator of GroEL
MSEMVLRLAILVLIIVFLTVMILVVWRFAQERRQRMLNGELNENRVVASRIDVSINEDTTSKKTSTRVRILAFCSEDSQQCRVLQAPVLRRVVEARGDVVSVMNIDAPSSPELTQRYHVLTVPTTVLLDASGKVHAVNYGFTNAQSLLKQIDEILSLDGAQEALS